ncbi:MAG: DUF2332 domain-containing protein [Actinomycetota bacterium]|nr:DUF2332 domain-containing protein [Actinomycetota bacterium]
MVERVPDAAAAADAFRTLADAEGSRVPTYARLCRIIADRPELHGLLLEAPTGQRLPVLLIAAIHDVVLRDPSVVLAAWYPSVTGEPPSSDDPTTALLAVVEEHHDEIVRLVRTRQVQTNEVNRCVAWQLSLGALCAHDDRPLALVELGASAGLNLRLDDYSIRIDTTHGTRGTADTGGTDAARSTVQLGPPDSTVRLGTRLRTGAWAEASRPLPPVVHRVGLDLHPLAVTDPDDARWLAACTWPEQRERFERLTAAIDRAAADPPTIVVGDMIDDAAALVDAAPAGAHVAVLASWALTYVERARRSELLDSLTEVGARVRADGGRLTLSTLDAGRVLPWIEAPPIAPDADADHQHASLLSVTEFTDDGVRATPLAWAQAHLAWAERLS